jgi:phosphatidylinositol glycan class A protein
MNLQALFHSKTLGIRAVFTDHSLFGFADAASIHINKTLKWILTDVDAAICVSHINKENLTLRAAISPNLIYVI